MAMTAPDCPHMMEGVDPRWCSICRAGGAVLPPPPPARPPGRATWLARYPDVCLVCGGPIEVGDVITRDDPDGYRHKVCDG